MNCSTIHIQQRSNNDCALAAIAMAAGKERWSDLWTQDDLDAVIKSKGVSDLGPYLERAGIDSSKYKQVYTYNFPTEELARLLWGRRALVSIASLNTESSNHLVYWDGTQVWDPQKGVAGKQHLVYLRSASIQRVTLLLGNV